MAGTDSGVTEAPTLFGPHLPLILLGTTVHRQEKLFKRKDGRVRVQVFWTVHGEKEKFSGQDLAVQAAYGVLFKKLMGIS